jgi:hypothetical protein
MAVSVESLVSPDKPIQIHPGHARVDRVFHASVSETSSGVAPANEEVSHPGVISLGGRDLESDLQGLWLGGNTPRPSPGGHHLSPAHRGVAPG